MKTYRKDGNKSMHKPRRMPHIAKIILLKNIGGAPRMLKCKNQVICEACKQPIRLGQWYDVLAIDNHNMGHTHKTISVHEECRQRAIEELC